MASLTLTGEVGYFEWEISGLSWWFDKDNYIRAGICREPFTSGTTDEPSGIFDYVEAAEVGTTDSFTVSNSLSCTSGTYTFYGFTQVTNGTYYSVGSATVIVKSDEEEYDRPNDWSWYTTIKSGSDINISAREWNDFTSRINAFREYDGLSDYNFTYVYSGTTPISASICNEARSAISPISGRGTLPSRAVSNSPLTASFFNGLMNALNSVP